MEAYMEHKAQPSDCIQALLFTVLVNLGRDFLNAASRFFWTEETTKSIHWIGGFRGNIITSLYQ